MDYTWSLLRFLKLTLVVTSIYWCVLLSVLVFLLLGQCSSQRSNGADSTSDAQGGLLTVVFVIILSVCGGALVTLLVAFHLLSQHYCKDSGKIIIYFPIGQASILKPKLNGTINDNTENPTCTIIAFLSCVSS